MTVPNPSSSSTRHSTVSDPNRPTPAHPSVSGPVSNSPGNNPAAKATGRWWIYGVFLALAAAMVFVAFTSGVFHRGPVENVSPTLAAIPATYDASRSFSYLQQLCDIGRRPSGSPGMQQQQELLAKHFRQRGAQVSLQTFQIRHPENGSDVSLANLIASWHADRPKRYLICAHYDTRPFPDQDRNNPKGVFVGANDGASGTAGLMELANQMNDLPDDVGVDLVAFDGEEFVFQQGRDDYFLGSTFFAQKYKATPPAVPYRAGVLLDMIGDRELRIYYERNSLRYAPKVARQIWGVARKLRVRAFIPKERHEIQDDHLPLNRIAEIPTVDLIDFDYPREGFGAPSYWHTEQDVPANCSGESIAAVVWVVHEWLKKQ
ncbi:M28 family peptidase [Stieleria marina]